MNKLNLKNVLTAVRDMIMRNRVAYKDYLGEETVTKTNIIAEGTLVEKGALTLKDSSISSFIIGESYDVTIDGVTEAMIAYDLSVNSTGYRAPAHDNIIALGNLTDLSNLPSDGWAVVIGGGIAECKTLGSYIGKSISISQTKTITEKHYDIKKLPDELLPSTVAKKTEVTAVKKLAATAHSTAENAQTAADNAQFTANNAQTAAATAQSTAENAQTAADNAQTAADNAQFTANNAQTAAATAQSTAENAQTTAQTAQTTANKKADIENPIFTGTFSQNRKANSNIGEYSHAEGYDTIASGKRSHAEGSNTIAQGSDSHAEGHYTTAIGLCSHAEGNGTNASGGSSHAEGNGTTASGNCSHAEGYNTKAFYSGSNTAIIVANHAEGENTVASRSGSHAEGSSTTASGSCSHSEGYKTTAEGNHSHAEGSGTTASSNYSHAEGNGTKASGESSHAEGNGTTASGESSHAEGYETIASGSFSHAEGFKTTASGSGSHAEGNGTKASGICSHVEGNFNIEDSLSTYIHIAGNGESADKPSNAYTLDWDGNGWFAGTIESDAIILRSSTSDITKKFKLIVDDRGVPSFINTKDDTEAWTPTTVTDDHINELINTALGVIENGSY